MQLRSALLAATVLAMPFAASAQPVTGLYIGAGAGVNITQKEHVKSVAFRRLGRHSSAVLDVGNIKGSTGFAGVLSLGWGFGNGLRAEVEGNYRNNQSRLRQRHVSNFGGSAAAPPSRSSAAWSTCCTTSTASRRGSCRTSVPASVTSASTRSSTHPTSLRSPKRVRRRSHLALVQRSGHGHDEGSFAYQAILGAAFPMPSLPGPGTHARVPLPRHHRQSHATAARRLATSTAGGTPAVPARQARARATTTRSWSACATTSASPRRRRRPPQRFRPRRRRAPIWCSSIGTRRRSPIARARSSRRRPTTRPRSSTRGSR